MKKTGLIFLLAIGFIACQNADQQSQAGSERQGNTPDSASFTTIQWLDSTELNLGKVNEGQILEVAYHFKNTGTRNLVIENVQAGCGCTVAEKPEKPFAPGEEGVIRAKFDSKDRVGPNHKNIMVRANTAQRDYTLLFTVDVTPSSK